jgi:hypothetical protein
MIKHKNFTLSDKQVKTWYNIDINDKMKDLNRLTKTYAKIDFASLNENAKYVLMDARYQGQLHFSPKHPHSRILIQGIKENNN